MLPLHNRSWSGKPVSNRRPRGPKPRALPTELHPVSGTLGGIRTPAAWFRGPALCPLSYEGSGTSTKSRTQLTGFGGPFPPGGIDAGSDGWIRTTATRFRASLSTANTPDGLRGGIRTRDPVPPRHVLCLFELPSVVDRRGFGPRPPGCDAGALPLTRSALVPLGGLEPPRPREHPLLRRASLPIPTQRLVKVTGVEPAVSRTRTARVTWLHYTLRYGPAATPGGPWPAADTTMALGAVSPSTHEPGTPGRNRTRVVRVRAGC